MCEGKNKTDTTVTSSIYSVLKSIKQTCIGSQSVQVTGPMPHQHLLP